MENIRPFQIPQVLDNILQLIKYGPKYPELAPVAIRHVLASVHHASPGYRLELHLKTLQPALLQAAEKAGCTKRSSFHQLATRLE